MLFAAELVKVVNKAREEELSKRKLSISIMYIVLLIISIILQIRHMEFELRY